MTMTIDLQSALAGLNRLAMLNMSPWMALVGQREQQAAQTRIQQSKQGPDGAAWAPWRPLTREIRTEKGNAAQGLLWDEGTLLHSIQNQSAADGVSIGTPVWYAGDLQDGKGSMPARPFLGWSDTEVTALEFSAIQFIEALL